jgi:L-asparaginase
MRILVITTGGTIVSTKSKHGLIPTISGEVLLRKVPQLSDIADVEVLDLLSVDSSSIGPYDWRTMVEALDTRKLLFDAFIISHGTDTMAYTAAALSFVMRGFPHPIIITGAMLPMEHPRTDARDNLLHSFIFARTMKEHNRAGVAVCFAGMLMHGPRVKKMSTRRMDAFESLSYPVIGKITGNRAVLTHIPRINTTELLDRSNIGFDASVLPVKIFPGFPARYMEQCVAMKPKAIVLECFGMGGLPDRGENIFPAVEAALDSGIIVIAATQCPQGGVDLTTYAAGRKMLSLGVISAGDMGFEAIIAKVMWLLPRVSPGQMPDMFTFNFCDEIGW